MFAGLKFEEKIISHAQEVRARGGFIAGVLERNDSGFNYWINVLEFGYLNPIIQAMLSQILAY